MDIDKVLEGIDKVGEIVDDSFESEQERQETLTERQRIDLSSPYKLPHLIRPVITLWSMLVWNVSVVWSLAVTQPDPYVLAATSGILASCVGWYFDSRRREKIADKKMQSEQAVMQDKTKAAIKLELIKTRADIRAERRASRRAD